MVLWLFLGETLDTASREFGVTPGKVAEWRDKTLVDMPAGLQSRTPDHRDGFMTKGVSKSLHRRL